VGDLSDHEVETVETVADRVRRAFPFTSPDAITIATDCGMKYLPRASAEGKMRAMAGAAAILRTEV
jgi:5-methyltetrahydropteroyltriglutamate--homocysteine methyltransferase